MITEIEMSHPRSFQYRTYYPSDNPLEEVWDRIQRFGAIDYLNENFTNDGNLTNWEECKKYAQTRLQQSIEFRNSAKASTFLTSPLLFYYSFLNILRAYIALKHEKRPKKGHGLCFKEDVDILLCEAKVTKGTFADYLQLANIPEIQFKSFTLTEVFERINELNFDLFSKKKFNSNVYSVELHAFRNGRLQISFLNKYKNINEEFSNMFPHIASDFKKRTEYVFTTTRRDDFKVFDNVVRYVNSKFETFLLPSTKIDYEKWYLVNTNNSKNNLTRSSYYFLAMFILSNIVRYEPESLLKIYREQSDIFWIIKYFLKIAERYYPQLIMMELNAGIPIYF